jgi:membrane protease subunit HflC
MSDKTERARRSILGFIRDARGEPSRLWLAAAAIVLTIVLFRSCTSIDAGEVAVRVNNISGSTEVITQPGLLMRLPFGIHSVYRLDVSPQTFHLRGHETKGPLEVHELTVRASDGSQFAFNDTTLLFRAIPNKADETLRDSGLGHAYYEWMLPYARSILRDEFGLESTISVSNPASFGEAEARAKRRLNKLLGQFGIEVTSIVTPRPRFSKEYARVQKPRHRRGRRNPGPSRRRGRRDGRQGAGRVRDQAERAAGHARRTRVRRLESGRACEVRRDADIQLGRRDPIGVAPASVCRAVHGRGR